MTVRTSSGFAYSFDSYDNAIVDGEITNPQDVQLRFKTLEEITELPNVNSYTISVTEQCNLRCSYCCYSGNYPEHRRHSSLRLSKEKISSIINFISCHTRGVEVTVDFYGGESLLELDWIKTFVDMANKISAKRWNFEISTNGLLLGREVTDWLANHNFKIFVSVDGIEDSHDKCRKDAAGQDTFTRIYQNLMDIRDRYPRYWENNVYILMTIQDISLLPTIAEQWVLDPLFKEKMPYRISEIATRYDANVAKTDVEEEMARYTPSVEWYRQHPDNEFMKCYFSTWLAEWINRPIIHIDCEVEYPTCVPHNRRLYIDASGNIGICELITDAIRIGTIEEGIEYTKVNEVAKMTAIFVDERCSNCKIARLCDICPDVLRIPENLRPIYCHNQKVMQQVKFRTFCELAEADLI